MLSLTSVSMSKVVIGNVANRFKLPCQRVRAVAVTIYRRPNSNQLRPLSHHASLGYGQGYDK